MRISRKRYLQTFGVTVVVLGIVRAIFPQVAEQPLSDKSAMADTIRVDTLKGLETDASSRPAVAELATPADVPSADEASAPEVPARSVGQLSTARFFNPDGTPARHRIYSVYNFGQSFPDQNDVQLVSAQKWGVQPVADRVEAEKRKQELVYVGSNPFFHVDNLKNSIPYLVPEASVLLQDIGRNFFDSLQIKGIPLHRIIVTSVLRSKEDVEKLRGRNGNATVNSCHLYGTTFDVCYNRYQTVADPDGPARRQVRNDSLKWVLSEVLNDMRKNNRCWIKYEVKQGCFHITLR